jgi:ATP-dependent RNA helicase DeaD
MDNLTPARLMGLINECVKKRDIEIGKIEILKSFSFFEIDKSITEDVIESMNQGVFNDRRVIVELTAGQNKRKSGARKNKWGKRNNRRNEAFAFEKKGKKKKHAKKGRR